MIRRRSYSNQIRN